MPFRHKGEALTKPTNNVKRILVCLLCLTLVGVEGALAQDSNLDSRREAWVIMAREGQSERAIDGLSRLHERTGNQAVLSDLIALLIRDSRYAEALGSCGSCRVADYTVTSLEALGLAARETGDLEQARGFYQALIRRQPDNLQGWLGLVLVDIQQGAYLAAGHGLQDIGDRLGVSDDWLQARIYLATQANDALTELRTRHRLVRRNPENVSEVQALYRVAVSLGARHAARNLLRDYPGAFTRTDTQWLDYYDAAAMVRLAQQAGRPERGMEGLQALDAIIDAPQASPELVRLAQYDKIVALVYLRRFREARELAARLEAEHGELPHFVTRSRADALSGLGQPSQAIRLYRELAVAQPELARSTDNPMNTSLIYAYADAQQYRSAQAVLDRWEAKEPDALWNFAGTTRLENPNIERIEQLEISLTTWRGDEKKASRLLDDLLDQAPGNASLWHLKGDLSRWRGWPRQAEQDYQHAAQLRRPEDRQYAEDAVLLSRLERGQWRGTVDAIEERLETGMPTGMLDSLKRNLKEQRAGSISVTGSRGNTEGKNVQSSRDWRYEARIDAPRNNNGSRFFARRIGMFGEYNERPLHAAYTTAGYELNLYPAILSVEAGHGAQLNDDATLAGHLSYSLSDHWRMALGAEVNSIETPLRALFDDVNADRYQVETSYRRDEDGSGSLGLSLMDFDDGNLRRSVYGRWVEQFHDWDEWEVKGTLFAGGSRNDSVAASYFNPASDASVDGVLEVSYSLPLGYRKNFTQYVTLGSGSYWQEDFGSDVTWQIGYGHRWTLAPSFGLEYGFMRQRSVYDGDAEFENSISVSLEWSFL